MDLELYSADVIQAYLQSAERLKRKVFINDPKGLLLDEDKVLKLLKPFYVLADSGDYWGKTLTDHLRNELGMDVQTGDGAIFFNLLDNKLKRIVATYVE